MLAILLLVCQSHKHEEKKMINWTSKRKRGKQSEGEREKEREWEREGGGGVLGGGGSVDGCVLKAVS